MINAVEWYRQYQEYFEQRGVFMTNLEVHVGQDFAIMMGRKMPAGLVNTEVMIEISILAESRDVAMDVLHDEYFLNEFELAIISTSYGINRDGWYEGTVTFHQTEPRVEWVEL